MSTESDYRATIARARREESESRAYRRTLRNEQQEALSQARLHHARNCFLSDVRCHVSRHSIAEESVMFTLRSTAACWAQVCDRAITRQLRVEAAAQDRSARDADHLERTHQREVAEQANTEESDAARWRELNVSHAAGVKATGAAAVAEAMAAVWAGTSRCLSQLHGCRLSHAGTRLLAALASDGCLFSIDAAGIAAAPASTPHATRQAFAHIFHGCPYRQSSNAFLALLQYCYAQFDVAVPLANVLHLCPVPLLAVDGPKYSGKTLLTEFLKSKFRLLCISDESLVRRAMQAAVDAPQDAPEATSALSARTSTTTTATSAATVMAEEGWAAHGRRIRSQLLAGASVSAATVVDLLYLFLMELRADGAAELPYDAVLLEGVLRTADTYRAVAQRLHSLPTHPFAALQKQWHLVDAPSTPVAGAAASSAAASSAVESARSSLAGGAATALADVPEALRLQGQSAVDHDASTKQEPKGRPMKKVDLAALPPPELPEVEDTQAQQAAERAFIASANAELASLPTVLSGLLHIRCPPEEVFRRFAGLRLDLETGAVYHLTYNPPPRDRLPHVVNLGRPDVSSVQLHEAVFQQREEWAAVQRWLSRQDAGAVFARVYELAGDGPVPAVHEEALSAVQQVIEGFRISARVLAERDAAAARLEVLEVAQRTQRAAREGERLRLAAVYNEKGVALPPLLQTPVEGTCRSVATFGPAAAAVVLQSVSDFTAEYEREYGALWLRAAQLVKLLLAYYSGAEEQLGQYWARPDDKQAMLHRFQCGLDSVPAHLRAQAACKAELHLSLDELADALHHCIELRDAEARGLIDAMCGPATFLAGWETLLCQEFTRVLQCEADRFLLALRLFAFFFGATTGEPLAFDDVEMEVPALTVNAADRPAHTLATTEATNAAAAAAAKGGGGGKEKRAATSKKTHGKAVEESSEKSVEEQFADVVQAALGSISGITDRLKGMLDAQAKGQKRTGGGGGSSSISGAASSHFSHVTAKCFELMDAERAATAARIAAIHTTVQTLLHDAETHTQQRRAQLEASLLAQMAKEAAAVNSAIGVLRGCVEGERQSPRMHLGCSTFAVLDDAAQRPARGSADLTRRRRSGSAEHRRSFLTDVPLTAQLSSLQVSLHPGLTAARLLCLVQQFRSVAPDYQLSLVDFFVLVREADYAEAVATRLDTAHTVLKTREEVFRSFDPQLCGFLDWRELVLHLLFWVVPASPAAAAEAMPRASSSSSAGGHGVVSEVSLQDLVETRANLGLAPLTEEQFFDVAFFFDRHLDDATLEAYTRVLWCTFSDPATQTLDPYVLLGFLCADPQPIRGAQKAFELLSRPGSAARVSLDEMDALCHLKATNARAMGATDPCGKVNLRLLFGSASTLSFTDVCLSPMGRKMLNHADLFRRRTFVKRKQQRENHSL